mgnify:FL=1
MNKNNLLHDAHVKAYHQKQSDEAHKSLDKVLTKTISKIESVEKQINKISEEEYQQTVLDLNEYQQKKIQKLHDDIYVLIHSIDVPTDVLCNSIPNHIMTYLYRDLLHRIGKDMVDNKYNI